MTDHVTVQLADGALRGRRHDGYLSFQGIPYAAPPTGQRRWRPPAPVEPWPGLHHAVEPGNPAPQPAQPFTDITAADEDCLTLNITVPDNGHTARPVLVWLHGGGGTNGTAATYDPHRIARTGDVIVVAPNFRLGILACFGHPGLTDSGTFGLQDQQAALRWVQHNITRFGGDPANITLAGSSYGAQSVLTHLTAPGSAGLFHRAILQSPFTITGSTPAHTFAPGLPTLPPRWTPVTELHRLGATVATEHGWTTPGSHPETALTQLRRVPVRELLHESDTFIRPAYGSPTLPEPPGQALIAGRFHRVPVLLGTTRDEAEFFVGLFADATGNPVTTEQYPLLLTEAFGEQADTVATQYPLAHFPAPSQAWARLSTDHTWARPAWELGQALTAHTATWFYEFADTDAPPPAPGLATGAQHGSELAYQFDLPGSPPLTTAQRVLAETINRYWTTFATHGNPNDTDLPAWPTLGTGHVHSLAPHRVGHTDYVTDHRLDFWANLPGTRGPG